VVNAYYVAGTPEVPLEVVSSTIEDHQHFAYELSEAFPNLKNVQSWIVLERLKRSFAPPINAEVSSVLGLV